MSPGGCYQDGRGWGLGHWLTQEGSLQVAEGRRQEPHSPTKGWLGGPHPCGAPCHPPLPSTAADASSLFAAVSSSRSQSRFSGRGSIPSLLSGHRPSALPTGPGVLAGAWRWRLGQGVPLLPGPGARQECAAGTKAASVRRDARLR